MADVHPLVFVKRPRPGRLARLGDWMAAHRRAILAAQWVIVVFYAVLVVLPAFLPQPKPAPASRPANNPSFHMVIRMLNLFPYLDSSRTSFSSNTR